MKIIRLLALAATAAPATAQSSPCAWQAEERLLTLEVEEAATTASWVAETDFDGYTGSSYYRWAGSNHFNNPGNGVLSYSIEVHEAGRYELRIHNRHEHPDHTMENDCWVRMDGGDWIKLYSNGSGTVSNWNWRSRFEIHGSHSDAGWDLGVGRHDFQISGRSNNFMIDRLSFYKGNPAGAANTNAAASPCGIGANFCSSAPNSSGGRAIMGATGSVSVADNALILGARPVPNDAPGIFFFGNSPVDLPFGNGRRCIGGQSYRLQLTRANGALLSHTLDFDQGVASVILPGSTWHFQAWFRDPSAGGAGFDLSDGFHVNFMP